MWFTAQKERQAERQNRIKAQSQVRIFVLGSVFVFSVFGNSRDYQKHSAFINSDFVCFQTTRLKLIQKMTYLKVWQEGLAYKYTMLPFR